MSKNNYNSKNIENGIFNLIYTSYKKNFLNQKEQILQFLLISYLRSPYCHGKMSVDVKDCAPIKDGKKCYKKKNFAGVKQCNWHPGEKSRYRRSNIIQQEYDRIYGNHVSKTLNDKNAGIAVARAVSGVANVIPIVGQVMSGLTELSNMASEAAIRAYNPYNFLCTKDIYQKDRKYLLLHPVQRDKFQI